MRLKELLDGVLSGRDLQLLVGAYDVVGDIVIMTIPRELETKEREIAAAILANSRKVKVVAKRTAHYGGEYRSRPIAIIGGEDRKETEVREFGVRLSLHVEKVYFSIRSGNERRRIASLVMPEEQVLVLFSGIGPYPLMISRYSLAKRIAGIEKNPVAHEYALVNLKLNRRADNVELFLGDIVDILPQFTVQFDRIIMPLPKSAGHFVDLALTALRPGGCLHFYDMQHSGSFSESVAKVRKASALAGLRLLAAEVVSCGHCGPRTYRICVDARIG